MEVTLIGRNGVRVPSYVEGADLYNNLSPQQKRVMVLIGTGHGLSGTAEKLFISTKTVETHLSTIRYLTGFNNAPKIAHYVGYHRIADLCEWDG